MIVIQLWVIFINTESQPNTIHKELKCGIIIPFFDLIFYTCGWLLFTVGLFQIKLYSYGKERLALITFIFGAIAGYLVFLYLIFGPTLFIKNGVSLFIASIIAIFLSHSKRVKKIYLESKKPK